MSLLLTFMVNFTWSVCVRVAVKVKGGNRATRGLVMIKDTSLDAFFDLKHSRRLQEQERMILSKMKPYTAYTRRELAHLAGIETSTASARINAMLDMFIEIVGKKKDPVTGKTVEALMLKMEKAAA